MNRWLLVVLVLAGCNNAEREARWQQRLDFHRACYHGGGVPIRISWDPDEWYCATPEQAGARR